MSSDSRAVGERIRDLRERAGLRQNELADKAGISGRYLRSIESGDSHPTRVTYLRIANALGVAAEDMDALIGNGSAA